jgi:hypothetical protein
MKALEVVLVLVLLTWMGIVVVGHLRPKVSHDRAMDLDARECVQACIKAMQDDQVFPDFAAIVKECDSRFGDGCKLVRDPE